MARTTGVEITGSTVRVVEIDGSAKKFRVIGVAEIPIDPDEERFEGITQALRAGMKAAKARKDQVVLGYPAREAVIREILIPFTDADQIKKVIKFESEGHLHGVDIEDVVVDFEIIGRSGPRSRVLIVAVRKEILRGYLECLRRCGIDPAAVDLDAAALFSRARQLPAILEEEEGGYAILDLGDQTSTLVVANGPHLRLIRSLRLGSDSMTRALSHDLGIDRKEARGVTQQILSEDLPFASEGDLKPGAPSKALTSDQLRGDIMREKRNVFAGKVVQEMRRSLSTVQMEGKLQGIFLTGAASTASGLEHALREAFGVRVANLDVLHDVDHKLDHNASLYAGTGIGLALKALGHDPVSLDFRQEDLTFTKKFDKIRFPLAAAGVLLFTVFAGLAFREWYKINHTRGKIALCARTAGQIFDTWIVKQSVEKPDYLPILGYDNGEHLKKTQKTLDTSPEETRVRRYKAELDKRLSNLVSSYGVELDEEAAEGPEQRVVSALARLTGFVKALTVLQSKDKELPFKLETLKVTADEITWTMQCKNKDAWVTLATEFRQIPDYEDAKRGRSTFDSDGWERLQSNRLTFKKK